MANLTKEQVMEELTALGVQYDPELSFNEMRSLLKQSKAAADGAKDGDQDDEDSGDGEGGAGDTDEKKQPEKPAAPTNPRLPKTPPPVEEGEATRTINTNVKHNGTLYEKGTQVAVSDENFDGLEAGGFFTPVE